MSQWNGDLVRQTFVDYFCNKQKHIHVPSSPVVPYDDPTLLFANAGMNQFKPIFLGQIDPKSERGQWKRAANSQKCIRAGGKHNDLDDVGKDTYHHTFFEMLGNWSFGDYFQQEAIDWAWDLLTNVFKLDPNRLYATYFGGDKADNLPADEAARNLWKKYLPDSRILPFGRKENFWEMGETGPCGPCTEIHYDRIGNRDASKEVNADTPDVIEIWNLVFMQFNREESGKLTELPNKHVDTGMGFERLTSVLQQVKSNYDTDLFQPIFQKIQEITGAPAYTGLVGADDKDGRDTAYRIIGDHIRTLTFAITDGARPGPEGRNFVLRRICRRAVRAGKEFLKANDGFFHQLVDIVIEKFGGAFPELKKDPARVKDVIKQEEQLFTKTLARGINKFNSLTRKLSPGDVLSGDDAFLLYGTYGFPLDLITIMSNEKKIGVDSVKFNQLLEDSKILSVEAYAAKNAGQKFTLSASAISMLKEKNVPITNDAPKYILDDVVTKVKAVWHGSAEDGSFKDAVSAGEKCGVILETTNFYSYGGGQIADTGFISTDDFKFTVQDVQVFAGYVVHIGVVTSGSLVVGAEVTCTINNERRRPIMSNHTSTHMLNWALRDVVDPRSEQRGSVVSEDRFRFDFACGQALTRDQLEQVDTAVNKLIKSDLPVYIKEVSTDEAKKINGVRAMFAEAYPNPVRVVSIGVEIDKLLADKTSADWLKYSVEFCGGTHLSKTSEAQLFTIISEEPISAGVRRIEAVTGELAQIAFSLSEQLDASLNELVQSPNNENLRKEFVEFTKKLDAARLPSYKKSDLREKLKKLEERVKAMEKEEFAKKKQGSGDLINRVVAQIKESKSSFVVEVLEVGGNTKILSDTALEIVNNVKSQLGTDVAVLLFSTDPAAKKPCTILAANVPTPLHSKGLKANEWVSAVASSIGGKGGGSKVGDVAQGNAAGTDKVEDAVKKAKEYVSEKLN
eukprot:TRINITY_DN2086_c0_g1_i1.p1 TRINITY_DN2086_c0_g1~~TRINITY_DN2086_c0_g1_i1.p1  ORF type:complete len:962 (-),score=313.60 TRINITY_DN2086_c0_g1_i1:173-3058(-)